MKTVKQILEKNKKNQKEILAESLDSFADAGLLEDSRVSLIKRSIQKDPATMTVAERKSLVSFVETILEAKKRPAGHLPAEKDVPVVIILQRKAIRVFPDNQKIALYYSPALDKYVSIPYGPKNDALGIHLSEVALPAIPFIPAIGAAAAAAGRAAIPRVAAAGRGAASWGRKKLKDYMQKRADKKKAKEEKKKAKEEKKAAEAARIAAAAAAGGAIGGGGRGSGGSGGGDDTATPRRTDQSGYTIGQNIKPQVSGPGERQTISGQQRRAQQDLFGIKESASNFQIIKHIVENNIKSHDISFDDKPITVSNRIAKKLVHVHESLNSKNKKKLESMLNEDATSFKKAINFAIRS